MEKHIETLTREVEVAKEQEKIHHWNDVDFGVFIGQLMILKNKNLVVTNPDEYRKRSFEAYEETGRFLSDYGGKFFKDVNGIYEKYARGAEPVIIRREDPLKVFEMVKGKDIQISFDPEMIDEKEDKYANCALWPYGPVNATTGLANAFLEGHSSAGPIVTVMGFKNNPEHMEVSEPEGKMASVGTISRHGVKIVAGDIKKEDLEFIILRLPAKFFDEKNLTQEERDKLKDGRLREIFRGFYFGGK